MTQVIELRTGLMASFDKFAEKLREARTYFNQCRGEVEAEYYGNLGSYFRITYEHSPEYFLGMLAEMIEISYEDAIRISDVYLLADLVFVMILFRLEDEAAFANGLEDGS